MFLLALPTLPSSLWDWTQRKPLPVLATAAKSNELSESTALGSLLPSVADCVRVGGRDLCLLGDVRFHHSAA
jgi:hypothetical protein